MNGEVLDCDMGFGRLLWCWRVRDDELCVMRGGGAVVESNRLGDSEVVNRIVVFQDCASISGFTATTFGNHWERQEARTLYTSDV